MRIIGDAEGVLRDLFARYAADPAALPANGGMRFRATITPAPAASPTSSPGWFPIAIRLGEVIDGSLTRPRFCASH